MKYFPELHKNFALCHCSSCSHALQREIYCLIHTAIKILSTKNKSDELSRCAIANAMVLLCLINYVKQNTTCTCYLIEDCNYDKPWLSKSHKFMLLSNLVPQNISVSHAQTLMRYDKEDDITTLYNCFSVTFGCELNDEKPRIGKKL